MIEARSETAAKELEAIDKSLVEIDKKLRRLEERRRRLVFKRQCYLSESNVDLDFDMDFDVLNLSVRVRNAIRRTGITTIGDVLDMLDRGPDAMLAIRNFGDKSLDELLSKLREQGYLAGRPY
jgi:DNA-directed RNA polymerase alpha subunit